MSYQPIPNETAGGKDRIATTNDDVVSLLQDILKELKVMNMYLYSMNDFQVKPTEMEL